MSAPECIQCGARPEFDAVDVLINPYDRDDAFDAVLCKGCVNEVAGREIYAE